MSSINGQHKPTTLYVSDLDGTLLDIESQVGQRSQQIISDLTQQGAMITVATARTPATVSNLLRDTLISPPAIVMTGAAFYDCKSMKYSDTQLIDYKTAENIIGLLTSENINPFIYCIDKENNFLDVFHSWEMNHKEQAFYDDRRNLKLKTFHLGQMPSDGQLQSTILIFAIGKRESIEKAAELIKSTVKCSISVYPDIFNPESALVEIFAPGVSKSNAVTKLKQQLGADRLVVFGDNLNDLSMFEVADLSVAVENALPQVKDAADIVIGRNDSDSVALFIQQDFLS